MTVIIFSKCRGVRSLPLGLLCFAAVSVSRLSPVAAHYFRCFCLTCWQRATAALARMRGAQPLGMRTCSCWTCPSTHQRAVRRRACALHAKQQHSARSHKLGAHRDMGCGDLLLRAIAEAPEAPAASSGIAGRLRSSAAPALETHTPDDRRWQHQQVAADLPVRNSAGSASAEAEVSGAASAPDRHPMEAQAASAATSTQAWTYERDSAPGLGTGSIQRMPPEEQRSGGEGAAWVALSGAESAPQERVAEQSRAEDGQERPAQMVDLDGSQSATARVDAAVSGSGGSAELPEAERLRRQRISEANRGRRAWNTGRPHSAGASIHPCVRHASAVGQLVCNAARTCCELAPCC